MNLSALLGDLVGAMRGLRRAPGFTLVVVVTLSLGLGGTLATMSVMDRVLFRPPSGVSKPEQLRRIFVQRRFGGSQVGTVGVSYPDFEDFVVLGRGRAQFAGYSTSGMTLGESQTPVSASYVTRDFFDLLGVRPLAGRFFTPEELRPMSPAIDPVVLGFAFWRREFGSDSSVLGRRLLLTGRSFTVIGIAPSEFRGLEPSPVDLWVPIGSLLAPGSGEGGSLSDRTRSGIEYVARLEAGGWTELLDRLTPAYREGHRSESYADSTARMITTPLLDPFGPVVLRSTLEVRNASLSVRLMFVSIAVLLVSLLHGAIMLSLRAIHRRREIAIRLALGMPRARLVLQHAGEAAMIAVLAGAVGLLLAWWGAKVLDARVHSTLRPSDVVLDSRLVVVAIVLGFVMLVTTTLLPALTSRAISPTALRSDGVAGVAADSSLRQSLVAAETAACVALVMLAALSLRSLQRIAKADFGFDGDRVITLSGPFGTDMSPLREKISALPFVESVSVGGPLSVGSRGRFAIPGREPVPDSLVPEYFLVGQGFLRTAGVRLLAGRSLSDGDIAGAPNVVVISRTMAEMFWPGASPLGKCVMTLADLPRRGSDELPDFSKCRSIVGVVEDVRWGFGPAKARFFGPALQIGDARSRFMLIRTRQPALATDALAIEQLALPVYAGLTPRVRAIRVVDALEPQLRPVQAASTLFLLFGLLALLSAAGGVYGLINYQVSQRTREIGVRMALGANATDIARVVARWAIAPLSVGVVIGVAGALAGGRLIAAFLFETASFDPVILSGAISLVFVAALAAAIPSARRAVMLDPASALRHD